MRSGAGPAASPDPGAPAADEADLTEWLRPDFGYLLRGTRWLLRERTAHQWLEVGEHPFFGRLLRLDGALQCSELDEPCYHERLVHTALLAARRRRRVLVIGGGDGGAAEEVLKWPEVQHVDQVEIDGAVLAAARRFLGGIHRGVLDGADARLSLHVGDGLAWLDQPGEPYDVILLDLTDAGGPSTALWQQPFYRRCAQRLAPGGALALHVASPWAQADTCRRVLQALAIEFADVQPFQVSVPMSGGPWLMACCRPAPSAPGSVRRRLADPRVAADLAALAGPPLQQFDAALAVAQCCLPPAWQRAWGLAAGADACRPMPTG